MGGRGRGRHGRGSGGGGGSDREGESWPGRREVFLAMRFPLWEIAPTRIGKIQARSRGKPPRARLSCNMKSYYIWIICIKYQRVRALQPLQLPRA